MLVASNDQEWGSGVARDDTSRMERLSTVTVSVKQARQCRRLVVPGGEQLGVGSAYSSGLNGDDWSWSNERGLRTIQR